jgi:ubiquinone/menaquinone biosynthesis C-methylase UbiE
VAVTGDHNEQRGEHDEQRDTVRREFTRQAAGFEAPGSLFGDRSILSWIGSQVIVPAGARILDVAGGTGQLGRYLCSGGASALIVDLTDAMLAAGLRAVLEEGRSDVSFVRGDASALPFPDGQFDVVVSRFALHHMDDPGSAIAEMVRVCRPTGSLTLVDMTAGGALHDELERLRDPSHTRALAAEELVQLLGSCGREPRLTDEHEHTMPAEPWLDRARTPAAQRVRIRQVLEAEADRGEPSGLRASRVDGQLAITQRWLLVAG